MQEKGRRFRRPFFCCPAPRVSSHTLLSPIHYRRRKVRDHRRTQLNPALNGRNQGSANAGIRDASVTSTIRMSDRWPAVPILAELCLSGILLSQPIQSRFNTARNLYRGDSRENLLK